MASGTCAAAWRKSFMEWCVGWTPETSQHISDTTGTNGTNIHPQPSRNPDNPSILVSTIEGHLRPAKGTTLRHFWISLARSNIQVKWQAGVHEFWGPFPSALQTFYHISLSLIYPFLSLKDMTRKTLKKNMECHWFHPNPSHLPNLKKVTKSLWSWALGSSSRPAQGMTRAITLASQFTHQPPRGGVYKGENITGQTNHQRLNQPNFTVWFVACLTYSWAIYDGNKNTYDTKPPS